MTSDIGHRSAVCVAGVALGDIDLHSAWQAWRLQTSLFSLCGRPGACRHRENFAVAGVAPVARNCSLSCFTTHVLLARSSSFFCDLLEEVDMWGHPIL